MSASSKLRHGNRHPYDADDEGVFRAADDPYDWPTRAARGVLADLLDRQGIKHGFHGVDPDTRAEIVRDLADVIDLAARQTGLTKGSLLSGSM